MTEQAISQRATIFDIQSFSLHDGPGIRTTVFFKGCPLSCLWCHNPESNAARPQLMFHSKLCTGCMQCVPACRQGVHQVIEHEGNRMHVVDAGLCIGSGDCIKVCCYDALTLVGSLMTVDEVIDRVSKDLRYFALKGGQGGVTFSGGEPMLHVPFIKALVSRMPGVNFCMETSGYAPRESFEEVLPCIDLFLFDYKMTSPSLHTQFCGKDNALILENLDYLYESGKPIVLRLPLIPTINDSADHFDGIASLLRRYPKILRAEVMPYHVFGLGKSEELGKEIPSLLPKTDASQSLVQTWLEELQSRGCTNICVS